MQQLKNYLKSDFIRSVLALVGGTAMSQAIGLLALPLLTRIYTPSDFGVLAVFTALLGMISIIASFRYEIAIPLPELDEAAANLLTLSILCLISVTTLVTVGVAFFAVDIAVLMKAPQLAKYLWLLPIAIMATSAYNIFQFWATRKKAFVRIARTRIEQAFCGVGTQLIMGWQGAGALGLIVGQTVTNGVGLFGLARRAYKDDSVALKNVSYAEIKSVAYEYSRFPKYSTFEALANSAGIQLPLILIASLTTNAEAGYLMLAMRVLQAPMSLIGSSISQVYFSRAVEEYRKGSLGEFTANVIGKLAKVGIGAMVFVGIVSPMAFGLVFGPQWVRAGELVAWMTPWFILQFLAAPISMSLHVTANQRKALILTVFGLLLRVSMLYLGAIQLNGHASESYALSGFIFYFICLGIFCNISNVSIRRLLGELKKSLPITGIAILLAICLNRGFSFWLSVDVKNISVLELGSIILNTIKIKFVIFFQYIINFIDYLFSVLSSW